MTFDLGTGISLISSVFCAISVFSDWFLIACHTFSSSDLFDEVFTGENQYFGPFGPHSSRVDRLFRRFRRPDNSCLSSSSSSSWKKRERELERERSARDHLTWQAAKRAKSRVTTAEEKSRSSRGNGISCWWCNSHHTHIDTYWQPASWWPEVRGNNKRGTAITIIQGNRHNCKCHVAFFAKY